MLEAARAELLVALVARVRPLAGVDAVVLEKTGLVGPEAVEVALVALEVLLRIHVHVPPTERVLLVGGATALTAVVGDLVHPQQRRHRELHLADVARRRVGTAVLQQLVLRERRLVVARLLAYRAHDRVQGQRGLRHLLVRFGRRTSSRPTCSLLRLRFGGWLLG